MFFKNCSKNTKKSIEKNKKEKKIVIAIIIGILVVISVIFGIGSIEKEYSPDYTYPEDSTDISVTIE